MLKHFITLHLRTSWQWLLPILLFISIALIFASSNTPLLPLIPLTLALFSSAPFLFTPYLKNGYLELLYLEKISLPVFALQQFALGWLFYALPLLLITGFWQPTSLMMMSIASIGLQALTTIVAALLASNKTATLGTILLLPLALPILIFAGSVGGFIWLLPLTLLYLAVTPWVSAILLKEALRQQ